MTVRHFLEVDDLSPDELREVIALARRAEYPKVLAGKTAALIFEKPSLRTRNSSEVAIVQLGGHPLTMFREEVGLGVREPVADVARVLSRYHAAISARVFAHSLVEDMAANAGVPVINLLSDEAHPCQAVADVLTIEQRFGSFDGIAVSYVGDFNNVARSLAIACGMLGMPVRLGCPPGYQPSEVDLDRMRAAGADVSVHDRPADAVADAAVVYTDVWASMGQESEAEARRIAFEGFTIDNALMASAADGAAFLHCLPAHRGEEVAAEVVDGPQSVVWQQAENRLHAYRALLLFLLGDSSS
ncbi:MAG TPA: ornithine carbamoyltransferase [Acidimicrobiales bacterium]|jgi:ornithine carbamoyltransferase|nr:ornithine carbamoyltransferase [Acidimicrobiales bacterium]